MELKRGNGKSGNGGGAYMKTVTSGKKRKRTSKKKRTGLDTHALVAKKS